jgi:hypothetical protein
MTVRLSCRLVYQVLVLYLGQSLLAVGIIEWKVLVYLLDEIPVQKCSQFEFQIARSIWLTLSTSVWVAINSFCPSSSLTLTCGRHIDNEAV